jgi:hypothetical protein
LGSFYKKKITYYDEDDLVYWTMGAPVEETTIINRCRKEQTYAYRLAHNDLPTHQIDITFDYRSDTPPGKDPDKYSATLRR